ncbi:hypothetical protein BWQ96_06512 [Gracilariopsis chorda]|uniref:CCHC-type domain-containing protein n=1 Tax=Gracilariopsis chorda TaxID=448386 RepID=A0A2V3INS3_9FLOR|nr:hypothetical protein BWQ96_06512 [Gracilariopsis chorda]|eukprot:PXF43735.1 hypothetical protein BWQ96_06512 [Gracilariopsis chorda]
MDQSWTTQTLYRSKSELSDYSSLASALASVLQKHLEVSRRKETIKAPEKQDAFHSNPRYGCPSVYRARTGQIKTAPHSRHSHSNHATHHHNCQRAASYNGSFRCHLCGSPNHFIRDCPLRKRNHEFIWSLYHLQGQSNTAHRRRSILYLIEDAMQILQLSDISEEELAQLNLTTADTPSTSTPALLTEPDPINENTII